jgi:localization factor PodJL
MTQNQFGPDVLNAGRTRRVPPEFSARHGSGQAPGLAADLNRELQSILGEINRLKEARGAQGQAAPKSQSSYEYSHAPAPRTQEAFNPGLQRVQDGLQQLKSEIRDQIAGDFERQHARLRAEIVALSETVSGTAHQQTFSRDIADLMRGISELSAGTSDIRRSQHDLSAFLEREIGAINRQFRDLATSESISSLDSRWASVEGRMEALEEMLRQVHASQSAMPDFDSLGRRLDDMHGSVKAIDFETMEGQLAQLARAVADLARNDAGRAMPEVARLENRFDEISRAIAALASGQPANSVADARLLENLEAALSLFGRKLELIGSMGDVSPSIRAIENRLASLQAHVESFPAAIDGKSILARIDGLAERIDSVPTPSMSAKSIDALSTQLGSLAKEVRSLGGASTGDGSAFSRLDERLETIERRIFELTPDSGEDGSQAVIDALELRFAQLSDYLASMQAPSGASASNSDDVLAALEDKISQIARNMSAPSDVSKAAAEAFDRLENQISDLSTMLSMRPSTPDAPFVQDGGFDSWLSQTQQAMLDTARQAAERVAQDKSANGSEDQSRVIGAIAGELAELERMTRNGQETTVAAVRDIHGLLEKIVARLSDVEKARPDPLASALAMARPLPASPSPSPSHAVPEVERQAPPVSGLNSAPGIDVFDDDLDLQPLNDGGQPRKPMTPAQMAQAAASAALGGAQSGRVQEADTFTAAAAADALLAPGAPVPDLNTILKRVRDQKKAAQLDPQKDADRKDFFSSVKRAAQAAAAEVAVVDSGREKKSGLANLKAAYAKFRRPILIVAAAAVVAIAALQLTSAFLGDDALEQPMAEATIELPAAAEAPAADGSTPAAPVIQGEPSANALSNVEASNGQAGDTGTPRMIDPGSLQAGSATPLAAPGADAGATPPQMAALPAIDPQAAASPDGAPASDIAVSPAPTPDLPSGFGPAVLTQAAKDGDAKAQFEVGRRLGDSTENAAAAFAWMNAAAAQGFAPAQYRVGNMYEKGTGVERSAADAKLWYQMAAESGNASAMHNLAVLFATGFDGTADAESAMRWFKQAADLGVADSQFNLGILYGKGQGVEQNLEEAYKWFSIVAKSGDTEAARKRDEVAARLRPEQLDAAKAAVDSWQPGALSAAANDITVPAEWQVEQGATASVDVKKAVTNVQLILGKLGYDAGSPDGVMGARTRDAIRAFQKAENLPVTGEIDAPLVKALLERNKG